MDTGYTTKPTHGINIEKEDRITAEIPMLETELKGHSV